MIEYLSYSSINLYTTCAESWRRKYLAKEKTQSSPALIFGSTFHSTIEQRLAARAQNRPLVAIGESWSENWRAKMAKEGETVDWGMDDPNTHHDDGLRIVTAPQVVKFIDDIHPLIDESGVFMERKITLTVPGVPVPIIGYIDIMTRDGVPGDFKTAAAMWTMEKAKAEIQPLFYLAALQQAGRSVPNLTFRHYVVTKASKPRCEIFEQRRTWDEIFWLFDMIRGAWNGIEKEVFTMNPGAWLCSPKFCSFYSQCRGKVL